MHEHLTRIEGLLRQVLANQERILNAMTATEQAIIARFNEATNAEAAAISGVAATIQGLKEQLAAQPQAGATQEFQDALAGVINTLNTSTASLNAMGANGAPPAPAPAPAPAPSTTPSGT